MFNLLFLFILSIDALNINNIYKKNRLKILNSTFTRKKKKLIFLTKIQNNLVL